MARLDPVRLAEHLDEYSAEAREIVRALRSRILKIAPGVEEDVRFRSLCYFRPGARFGSIGGNVCMIEVREGRVVLSFIHGASLPDPAGMLRGSGKAKRHVEIGSVREAGRREVAALVRAAAERRRAPSARKVGGRKSEVGGREALPPSAAKPVLKATRGPSGQPRRFEGHEDTKKTCSGRDEIPTLAIQRTDSAPERTARSERLVAPCGGAIIRVPNGARSSAW